MLEDCEPPVAERSKEDLEFEQMFEKMAADSYQERIKETVKPNTKDIPVPMMARTSKKSYEQITTASGNQSGGEKEAAKSNASNSAGSAGGSGGGVVPFVLMVRSGKGGKQQFKQFVAPSDSQLAINLKLQEEKTREEKERVKRLTLNITERIEEEDYQVSQSRQISQILPQLYFYKHFLFIFSKESLMQSQRNMSQNHYQRPSKPKFRHQKGAPDADLIFN